MQILENNGPRMNLCETPKVMSNAKQVRYSEPVGMNPCCFHLFNFGNV